MRGRFRWSYRTRRSSSNGTVRQFWPEVKRINLTLQRPVLCVRGTYAPRGLCRSGGSKVLILTLVLRSQPWKEGA